MPEQHFTPTQKRIWAILNDGYPHSPEELFKCLENQDSSNGALNVHITLMRRMLRMQGSDIVLWKADGKPMYLYVRCIKRD